MVNPYILIPWKGTFIISRPLKNDSRLTHARVLTTDVVKCKKLNTDTDDTNRRQQVKSILRFSVSNS